MSGGQARRGPRRPKQTLAIVVGITGAIGVLVTVAWPRVSLDPPVARQVVMSSAPVDGEDRARCWMGLVASWHGDLVNFYANTGCEGIDAEAVTVTIEDRDGHRQAAGCRDDQQVLLSCSARELEGSLRCEARCGDTVLTVTHRVRVPAGTEVPNLEATACALDDTELSCSYPLTMDTVTVETAWSTGGEDYLCVTRADREQRIALGRLDDMDAGGALVATPAGTAAVEATAEAVRGALEATGGLPDVAEEDHPAQCDDASPTIASAAVTRAPAAAASTSIHPRSVTAGAPAGKPNAASTAAVAYDSTWT